MTLQRYVSKELAHFVGPQQGGSDEQFETLTNVVREALLRPYEGACEPPGYGARVDLSGKITEETMLYADMTCFCDIPSDELGIHVAKYGPFGLSFLKSFLLRMGASPVFYVAMDATARVAGPPKSNAEWYEEQVTALVRLLNETWLRENQSVDTAVEPREKSERLQRFGAVGRTGMFVETHLLSYLKFFDASKPDNDPKNYYMEREWRVLGSVRFKLDDVHRVYLPEPYAPRLRERFPTYCGQVTFVDA